MNPVPNKIPALEIVMRPLASLVPYARNSRTHSAEQVAQIAASIREFGWTNPVLIDADGVIIAGHGRVMAGSELGMTEAPCIVLGHLTEAQRRAYVLADNKLALNAGWDFALLQSEIMGLKATDFDLSMIGFSDVELANIVAWKEPNSGLVDPDDTPEPPAEPVSVLGDLWILGNHRILCGDSTKAEDVAKVLGERKPQLCLTDPPYGLADTVSAKNKYDVYDDAHQNLVDLISKFFPLARQHCPRVVLTPGNRNQRLYPDPSWHMAWFVPAGSGRGPWGFCCWQPILCYGKDAKLSKGKGSFPDAIVHTETSEKSIHPCPKPINFWKWLLERTSDVGDLVYEPFSGSGTTIIAAEMTGRIALAIELSPAYIDVAVNRWQNFTGQEATHEDGRTFAQVAADRHGG